MTAHRTRGSVCLPRLPRHPIRTRRAAASAGKCSATSTSAPLSNWAPAKPLFDLITAHNWGSVWAREGLDRRTRTLLNLALLTALNRPEELRLYVRGALRNGCSVEDMAEVAVHCAAYAGGPAGISLMRAVHEVHGALPDDE